MAAGKIKDNKNRKIKKREKKERFYANTVALHA